MICCWKEAIEDEKKQRWKGEKQGTYFPVYPNLGDGKRWGGGRKRRVEEETRASYCDQGQEKKAAKWLESSSL